MENHEPDKNWPRSFKASVIVGLGILAAEGSYIGVQVLGIVQPELVNNVLGFVAGVAGAWRVAEPIIQMRELRDPGSTIFRVKSEI